MSLYGLCWWVGGDWVGGIIGLGKWVAGYYDVFVAPATSLCCDDFGIVAEGYFVDDADEGALVAVLIKLLGLEESVLFKNLWGVRVVVFSYRSASEVSSCETGFYVWKAGEVES
jgi:hypothetical protein